MMFLMHKWFLASEELAEAFVDLYPFFDEKKNKKQRERNRVPDKKKQQLSLESFDPLTDKFEGYSDQRGVHPSICPCVSTPTLTLMLKVISQDL